VFLLDPGLRRDDDEEKLVIPAKLARRVSAVARIIR
jgi:hypothetical protein